MSQNMDSGPLSDLSLIETITTYFVTVFIANNKGGSDSAAIRRLSEVPFTSRTLIRLLDPVSLDDILPRRDDIVSATQLVERCKEANRIFVSKA
jgi:hypothetical protein